MDCSVIAADLIAYHFGTTPDDARKRIDEHLLGCTDCLRAYLELKHHFASGVSRGARPSAAARQRLRAAVALEFTPSVPTRAVRWLRRPIPLYQGVAAAAVALALALIAPLVAETRAPSRARAPDDTNASAPRGERVDSARPAPESLSFY